jgi:hypothetical protein
MIKMLRRSTRKVKSRSQFQNPIKSESKKEECKPNKKPKVLVCEGCGYNEIREIGEDENGLPCPQCGKEMWYGDHLPTKIPENSKT